MSKVERVCMPSERIYNAMAIRKMRQVDLANKTGLNKALISQYLNGKYEPMSDKIYLMAKALEVDPVWLMGFDVPMVNVEVKTDNLQNADTKILSTIAMNPRVMAYVTKLMELPDMDKELIFGNIDMLYNRITKDGDLHEKKN